MLARLTVKVPPIACQREQRARSYEDEAPGSFSVSGKWVLLPMGAAGDGRAPTEELLYI